MNVRPIVLEGQHVRLEPLSASHAEALFRGADRSVYTHLLHWPEDDSFEAFKRWLEPSCEARPDELHFAIVRRDSGEPVGATAFLDIRPAHRTLEIGSTWIAPAHQGTAVNPEAKLLLLSHAFERLGAVRVQLKTSSENLRSQRAIERLGAVREGVLRNYQLRQNGRARDTVMFSITDAEWPRVRVGLENRLGVTPRQRLITELANAKAADAKEQEDLQSMRAFARELEEPFSRAQAPAHFTGSAVVVDPEGGRVCLVHHAKLGRWLQPGGHADPADEGSMALSALREAREETGLEVALHPRAPRPLDVDVHVIPARKSEPEHRHLDVRYLVVAKNPEALAHDPNESLGARWWAWDEAIAAADEPALRRMLEKARHVACPPGIGAGLS